MLGPGHGMARHRHPRVAAPGRALHRDDRAAAGTQDRLSRGDRLPHGVHRRGAGGAPRRAARKTAYGQYCSAAAPGAAARREGHAGPSIPDVLVVEPAVHRGRPRILPRELAGGPATPRWGCRAVRAGQPQPLGRRARCGDCTTRWSSPRGSWCGSMSRRGLRRGGGSPPVLADLRPLGAARALGEQNHRQLWIPPGFAHGFYVLSESADLLYKCTEYYAAEHERTLRWNDPDVGIDWPLLGAVPDPLGQGPRRSCRCATRRPTREPPRTSGKVADHGGRRPARTGAVGHGARRMGRSWPATRPSSTSPTRSGWTRCSAQRAADAGHQRGRLHRGRCGGAGGGAGRGGQRARRRARGGAARAGSARG